MGQHAGMTVNSKTTTSHRGGSTCRNDIPFVCLDRQCRRENNMYLIISDYDSYQRFVFQASSKFWLEDGSKNINLYLDYPDLKDLSQSADEVDTHRVIVLGRGPGGVAH